MKSYCKFACLGFGPLLIICDRHVINLNERVVDAGALTGNFFTGEMLTMDSGQQCWGDSWATGRPDKLLDEDG